MFDQMRNIRDFENGGQETKLGLMCGIDLEVTNVHYDIRGEWLNALRSGQITEDQIKQEITLLNNVCSQIRIQLKLIKPPRGLAWLAAREG